MVTRVTKVCVRHTPMPPDVAARNRERILKLQVRSILAAARANAGASDPQPYGSRGSPECDGKSTDSP